MAGVWKSVFLLLISSDWMMSQHVFDCPPDWPRSGSQCYKFISYPEESFHDAQAACDVHGATLLSVNSREEHSFIINTLKTIDPTQRPWYTSGIQTMEDDQDPNAFRWQGDQTTVPYDMKFWTDDVMYMQGYVIVYKYTGANSYSWDLVDGSETHPYVCEIAQTESFKIVQNTRDYDYGIQTSNINDLLKGPVFVSQDTGLVIVGKSLTAEVECVATGNPLPSYKWMRGSDGMTTVTATTDSRYTLTNGKLTIQSPNEKLDAGDYRCEVENKFGKLLGNPIQISFGFLGQFNNVQDAPVQANSYQGVAIQCSRIAYKPAVRYQWLKGNTQSFVRPSMQKYIFISANGKLYFSEVTRVDAGEYRCIAILTGLNKHAIGTSQPPTATSLPIELVVHDQAAKADWGPEIQNDFIAVFPQPPLRGQDIRMECFAYGSSTTPFTYRWLRQDKPMPPRAKLFDNNRVLVIEDSELEDSGNYTCTVSRGNAAGDSKTIALNLGAEPYFVIPLRNQHVDINSQLSWRCVARANPQPTYTWYKNGEVVKTIPGDVVISGSTLNIQKLDPDRHNGMYQCSAHNTHGVRFTGAQLRVLSFAPTMMKAPLPRITEVALNGNATLRCQPEGAPRPEVTWHKNGRQLSIDMTHFRQLANGYLVISKIQQSDGGIYMCKAVNFNGEASTSTTLYVGRSTVITTGPTPQQVTINETAFLYCQASSDPSLDMVYVWHFNDYLLDLNNNPHYKQDLSPYKTGLYIRNIQFRHAGVYRCTARTTLEADTQLAEVVVIGPPGEPAGVYVDSSTVTSYSAEVSWTPGEDNGRPVTHYNIEKSSAYDPSWRIVVANLPIVEGIVTEDNKLHADVHKLSPGMGYRFRVIALNIYGAGPPSVPSPFVQTPSAPPSVAPSDVRGGGGSVGDLTLRWKPLHREDWGSLDVGYIVYWRKAKRDAITTNLWRKKEIMGNKEKYVHLVGNDNYYLEYEVKVQAVNDLGRGPNSTIVVVFSAEAMPVGVPQQIYCSGYNGTAMEVTWKAVANTRRSMKGKVAGYQINYWRRYKTNPNLPPRKRFLRLRGQLEYGLVIGLDFDSYFIFNVQVYNMAGLGPQSTNYFGETSGYAPFHYPQEVWMISTSEDSIKLWWRGITTKALEEVIKGFKIYYWAASEDFRSAVIVSVEKVDTCILTNLETGIIYKLRIAAWSIGGEGRKSPSRYFTIVPHGGVSLINVDTTLASSFSFRSSAPRSQISFSSMFVFFCMFLCLFK